MLVKSKGIIFHRIKFSESSLIVKIFTQEFGLLSFLFQGVTSSRAKIRPAHLTPLNPVELNFYNHPNKNLKKIKELSCSPTFHNIHIVENKRAFGAFMLEILNRCVKEEEPQPQLYKLVLETLITLEESNTNHPWLPHQFLIQLSRIMGHGMFDTNYTDGDYFDLTEGEFMSKPNSINFLNPNVSKQLHELLGNRPVNIRFRKELLMSLITFSRIHYIGNAPLKSMEIYRQLVN